MSRQVVIDIDPKDDEHCGDCPLLKNGAHSMTCDAFGWLWPSLSQEGQTRRDSSCQRFERGRK